MAKAQLSPNAGPPTGDPHDLSNTTATPSGTCEADQAPGWTYLTGGGDARGPRAGPGRWHLGGRPSGLLKRRKAIGALFADLLNLEAYPKRGEAAAAGMHGASPNDFSSQLLGFARGVFMEVTASLVQAGLLQVTKGAPRWQPAFGQFQVRGGDLTTYRLTPAALALAEDHGVAVSDWSSHWQLMEHSTRLPLRQEAVVELRKARRRIGRRKSDPEALPMDLEDPEVRRIAEGVQRLNEFLEDRVGGFVFPGLRRVFSDGNQPDFRWNKGGRYYPVRGGHGYINRSSIWRRSVIRLAGEAVDEVDLRASHLTLLHALLQQPFDPEDDPYLLPDLPRELVKRWINHALGASNPRAKRWSETLKDDFEKERPGQWLEDQYPIREVAAAVKERHPLLIDLATCGYGPSDLMFHEAEILRLAMNDLMLTQGIPVLPVHDALIAPLSALKEAESALKRAFAAHVEGATNNPSMVVPKVTCKGQEERMA